MIISGDIDNRNILGYKVFMETIYGKFVGDKETSARIFLRICIILFSTAKVRYHEVTSYDDLLDEMSKLH